MFRREFAVLSLAKLRFQEVWNSFTEHTKRVDVWLKNDSEKGPLILLHGFHMVPELSQLQSLGGEFLFPLQECLRLCFL